MPGRCIEGVSSSDGVFRVWSADREVRHTAETLGTHDRYEAEQRILADLKATFDEIPTDSWFVRVRSVEPLKVSLFLLWELLTREQVKAVLREQWE